MVPEPFFLIFFSLVSALFLVIDSFALGVSYTLRLGAKTSLLEPPSFFTRGAEGERALEVVSSSAEFLKESILIGPGLSAEVLMSKEGAS